jgi:plastocyanin
VGAVQRLATVVILGLVALAGVLVLYVADESNRLDTQAIAQQHDAVERGTQTFLTQCLACHGPAGEGYTAPGEAGTGRIGAPIGGDTANRLLNQTGIVQTGENAGKPWSDPNNPQFGSGLEGRANFIRNRIHTGLKSSNGTVLMPAFGAELNGPLNDSQIDELVVFIQHADWNEVYNEAIETYDGYPTPPPAAKPTTEATPEAETDGGEESNQIVVDMLDSLQFDPAEIRIPPNTEVTLLIRNAGSLDHEFKVDDLGIATGVLAGGETATVTIPAQASGEFVFHCPVPGHTEGGMVGKIIIDPNATLPGSGGGDEATPVGSPEASPVGDGAGLPTSVEIDMVDVAFEPTELRIPANTDVTITAVNKGALPHTFTITDVADTGEVAGGSSAEVTVNLPAGEYEYFCAIPGHKEGGMVGKLIVEEGAAAAAPAESGDAAADTGESAESASGPVEIDMVDLAFEPTEITIAANTDVTINAVNTGALPHTFTIPDVADTGTVNAGETKSVTVNLPPGEYAFDCSEPGHKEAGMVGTLIVK